MKKFLVLFFCFAFVCACGKKQDLSKELLGDQKDEEQILAAMNFLTQETQIPFEEIKAAQEKQSPVQTEQKTEQKTAPKTAKTTAAETNTKQEVKTAQKQETKTAQEDKTQEQKTEQTPQETAYSQLPEGEKTIEIFLDPNNLPKEILKTKDGR